MHGHLYMEQYRAAYPDAELMAAPGLARKRRDLRFDRELAASPEHEWREDLGQALFQGHRLLTEIEFLHRDTRTLIAGDLVFNIGPDWPLRTKLWTWGPRMAPRLGPTVAFRLAVRDRLAAKRSVERILQMDFDRILPGHGEIIATGGKDALRNRS